MKYKQNIEIILMVTMLAPLIIFLNPYRIQAQTATTTATTASPAGSNESISGFSEIFKNGIVPCGHKDSADGTRPDDTCTLTDAFVAVARVTNFLYGFAAVFVVFKFVQASLGLTIARGNEANIKEAHEKLTNVFLGFLLILTSYVLIYSILYGILRLEGPTDIISNPTNFIQSDTPAPASAPAK